MWLPSRLVRSFRSRRGIDGRIRLEMQQPAALMCEIRAVGGAPTRSASTRPGPPGKGSRHESYVIDGCSASGTAPDQASGRGDVIGRLSACGLLPKPIRGGVRRTSRAADHIGEAVRHLGKEGRGPPRRLGASIEERTRACESGLKQPRALSSGHSDLGRIRLLLATWPRQCRTQRPGIRRAQE